MKAEDRKDRRLVNLSKDLVFYTDVWGFSDGSTEEQNLWLNGLQYRLSQLKKGFGIIYDDEDEAQNAYFNSRGDGFVLVVKNPAQKEIVKGLDLVEHFAKAKSVGAKLRFGLHYGENLWTRSPFPEASRYLITGQGIIQGSRVIDWGERNHIIISDGYLKKCGQKVVKRRFTCDNLGVVNLKGKLQMQLHHLYRTERKQEKVGCSDTPVNGTLKGRPVYAILVEQMRVLAEDMKGILSDCGVKKGKQAFKISALIPESTKRGTVLAAVEDRVNQDGKVIKIKSDVEFEKGKGLPALAAGLGDAMGIFDLPQGWLPGKRLNPEYVAQLKRYCGLDEGDIREFSSFKRKEQLPRTFVSVPLVFERRLLGVISVDSKSIWFPEQPKDSLKRKRFLRVLAKNTKMIGALGKAFFE